MIEKRKMMKFLTFCVDYEKHEEDYKGRIMIILIIVMLKESVCGGDLRGVGGGECGGRRRESGREVERVGESVRGREREYGRERVWRGDRQRECGRHRERM